MDVIEKIKQLYNKYEFPFDYKIKSLRNTRNKIKILSIILLVSNIIEYLVVVFADGIKTGVYSNVHMYYAIWAIIAILMYFYCSYSEKHKFLNEAVGEVRFINSMILQTELALIFMIIYSYISFDCKDNAIIIYAIVTMCNIIIVECNPIIYSTAIIISFIVLSPFVYYTYENISQVGNYFIFCTILCCVSFLLTNKTLKVLNSEKEIIAINNRLNEEVNKTSKMLNDEINRRELIQENILYAMADIVENRDTETGEHIKRTSNYVSIIAKNAMVKSKYNKELTPEYIRMIKRAAPLHDIGKISILDSILKAPRKLTKEEFDIMKTHTTTGAKIIKQSFSEIETKEQLDISIDMAQFHHEKWDGTGYPKGLKADEIPLCARIMALADVFDALTSERCYKPAFTIEEAFKIIEEGSGTHFDPELTKIFIDSKDEIVSSLYQ